MKKERKLLEKISSGKGFYITAGLSFVSIVIAIAFVYNSSVNMIEDLNIPTVTTKAVEATKENVPDPRSTTKIIIKTTTAQSTTSPITTKAPTTQTTVQSTTASTTQSTTETFVNESFVLPVSGEVIKAYSAEVPIYDETMGDWRVHKGTDFIAEQESSVCSVGKGKVTKVISDPAWGFCVEVDYGSFIGKYCGLKQGSTVKPDTILQKGDVIGALDVIPCEAQMESHLHFEVIVSGKNDDPIKVLNVK